MYTASSLLTCFGLVLVTGCAPHPAVTPPSVVSALSSTQLRTRPSAVPSSRHTDHAGIQPLDTFPNSEALHGAFVYVPPRSVGTHRSPLVILLHGSGGWEGSRWTGLVFFKRDSAVFRTFADQHGVILLAVTSEADSGWDHITDTLPPSPDQRTIDAALRTVLQHYAIDPTRIAVLGVSGGAGMALSLGLANGDVLSRVLVFSGFGPLLPEHQFDAIHRHGQPPLYIALNRYEAAFIQMRTFVAWARRAGYSVRYTVDDKPHMDDARESAGLAWLITSWR